MAKATTYDVLVDRVGRWWELTIPEVAGADGPAGQTKHLVDVEFEARALVAMILDVPMSHVEVKITVRDTEQAEDLQPRVDTVLELRARLDDLVATLDSSQRALVRDLRASGIPDVDAAFLLDVSRQRIGQLAEPPKPAVKTEKSPTRESRAVRG
ncbi:hypothetical protein AB0N05_38625 [Nocardia sp. NPDC051030]|uniref:hypothetical protein n=1 Tax=Nocardia sp. NPDC051030 TaxID=3155162 RepID=UPI00341A8C3A